MDTVTQIALGATIGALFQKKLGKRALLFGGFCGWFPDIDVLFHSLQSWDGLVEHRGMTHSVLILPFASLILGGIAYKLHELYPPKRPRKKKARNNYKRTTPVRRERVTPWTWIHLAFWALITHPLLDTCTSYGTQLLYPLNNIRYATDAIAIIDLMYTLPLLMACFWSFKHKIEESEEETVSKKITPLRLGQTALGLSSLYLFAAQLWSWSVVNQARAQFQQIGFESTRIRANPPIAFSFLRRIIAQDKRGNFMTANYSLFSGRPPKPIFKERVVNTSTEYALNTTEGQIFSWFANDYVLAEIQDGHLKLIDARYGLFQNPWWSPFQASASIQPDGTTTPLQLEQTRGNVAIVSELKTGWSLMIGNN